MIEFHLLANIFPLLKGADFDALVADIQAHGARDKITMYEGKILDGRNRYRALVKIGLADEDILRCHTEPLNDGVRPSALAVLRLDQSRR
ncbi:MAG TPA: hypothetical protein VKP67_01840 [Xanthobacteraceae bacterium]|nr:hypothetical protein [Xanthobacteraceae bacterium]